MSLHVIDHPVIKHKLSILRQEATTSNEFRRIVSEIASLMTYEMTRNLEVDTQTIKTPICEYDAPFIAGKKQVVVPILRAGLGLVEGITNVLPGVKIGHIGIYRDEETLEPQPYFAKFPQDLDKRQVYIVDPMLATGGTANKAIEMLQEKGVTNINLVCLVGCPEGVDAVLAKHPDVEIYLASLDEKLNDQGYIVPGLGDAGDRLFGTK